MFFWVFLVEELEKRVVMFGISALKFAKCKKILQTKKNQTIFGPKMPYLGILGCKFENVLSYFQHPRICQNAKFRAKLKILNFGTKNVGFRCF